VNYCLGVSFLCFSYSYPNIDFGKFSLFFNPLFSICIHFLFLYFFPIPVFWIPAFQRSPNPPFPWLQWVVDGEGEIGETTQRGQAKASEMRTGERFYEGVEMENL
jgi:hypothetical protein